MPFLRHVLQIADPRGRCNRRALLGVAIALLTLQALCMAIHHTAQSAYLHLAATTVELACLWLATSAAIKRLHDLGLSGWWIPAALVALFVWTLIVAFAAYLAFGNAVADPGTKEFMIYLCAMMVWPLAATVWMHFAQGQKGPNRYGPEPDESGLSAPAPQLPGTPVAQAA